MNALRLMSSWYQLMRCGKVDTQKQGDTAETLFRFGGLMRLLCLLVPLVFPGVSPSFFHNRTSLLSNTAFLNHLLPSSVVLLNRQSLLPTTRYPILHCAGFHRRLPVNLPTFRSHILYLA